MHENWKSGSGCDAAFVARASIGRGHENRVAHLEPHGVDRCQWWRPIKGQSSCGRRARHRQESGRFSSNNDPEVAILRTRRSTSSVCRVCFVKSTVVMKENRGDQFTRFGGGVSGAARWCRAHCAYVENDLTDTYDGDVHYARDAFEGLRLMDDIMATKRGGAPRTARRRRRRQAS